MTLLLHCLTFLHEIFWYFDLRVLLNLNIYHLHQNIKQWGIIISSKEINISPSAPQSIEQEYEENLEYMKE